MTGTGPAAGAPLVADRRVRHVTFTGSVPTGISVMTAAARNVATVVLELGGKSPLVVLADADLDAAAEGAIGAIFENAGQICSAGSRLIVERGAHQGLVARVEEKARALRMGHGLTRPTLGPLNSEAHLGRVAGKIDAAKARGLTSLIGGNVASDPSTGEGWFFEATIFDDVAAADPLVTDEIFGPVLTVQVAEDAEHALELANGTDYALVAGVYTRDFGTAHRLAREIDAGQVFVNEYFAGGIEVPFGGNRLSGFGREKGFAAMRNYLRTKSVAARIG
ncbi:aldehyde dehydrogenase family protein [Jiella pelagia]|uniref:Aldehyde dehydrogenase family protein n=1 Tax=Jiella pelagia TaxID=2986949 RepID=A0ABY7BWT0_9HYPH|nr:aldehyde dehydrogenase family protein [Jiella pelagia]WAP68281.1 aldehyde dehydrogenase family protein [Jiella pelagia]